ncbi:MAG: PD40 domain-containing protein [Anaerolineae bacterium]|jgi:dipeptidyl aminopeptidase/acylaminoacyl peptidase|nr:PD40 domain-containing protein [Anaerolineae bacterium]
MRISRWMLSLVVIAALAGATLLAAHGGSVDAQGGQTAGPVVYASDRSGNYELYTLDPDTGMTTQLTNNANNDIEPMWSPDGSYIAFASDRDGDYEIFVMNADGSDVRQLTNNVSEDRQPRWQPNGLYISFVSDVNGQWDLYIMTWDSTIVRQLTNDPADERDPDGAAGPATPETGPVPPQPPQPDTGEGETAEADAVVKSNEINIRENPGEGSKIVAVMPYDTPLDILARWQREDSWVQVVTPNGQTGWAFAALLDISIDLAGLPTVDAPYIAPPPTPTPTFTPSPTVNPVVINFWADRTTITEGECVTISWQVEGIKEVHYEGRGVTGSGSSEECPTETTTYELSVTLLDDTVDTRYITITVEAATP